MSLLPSREYLVSLRDNRSVFGDYSSDLVAAQQKMGKVLTDLAREGELRLPVFKDDTVLSAYYNQSMGYMYVSSEVWDELRELVAQEYELSGETEDYYALLF